MKQILSGLRRRFGLTACSAGMAGMIAATAGILSSTAAMAGMGQPSPRQLGLQEPATAIARDITWFHDVLLWVITLITLFVLALLVYVMWRFNETANPTPSRNSHNTAVEVAWTVIPIFILLGIAVPSFKLLYKQYDFPKADIVVKAIGHQWYWSHEYPELGVKFDSIAVKDEDLLKQKLGEAEFNNKYGKLTEIERLKRMYADAGPLWTEAKMLRKLSVDNELVLPVGKNVHVLITADDVIHNWTIPSFGVKTDAVPGRTLATWFNAEKTGLFYGQCSELCGKDHDNMPIAVRIVAEPVYNNWLAAMKARDRKKAREVLQQAAAEEEAGRKLASAAAARPQR